MLVWNAIKVLRAVVVKNRAGQKVTFSDHQVSFSNFESPFQSEHAGKFSDKSDVTSHFYRTRKVDDGKNHHLGIIFLASANNVRLTSKLYRMYIKEFSTRIWVIQSRAEVHSRAIGENRNFGHKLWVFFSIMSHTSHI